MFLPFRALFAVCLAPPLLLGAANVTNVVTYSSSVSSDGQGALDLKMELNYNNAVSGAPIAVIMHGFSGSFGFFSDYRATAQRLRDQGFFVLTVAMRGREGSDGVRDSGGVEIYDIYDAVEFVKANYGASVNSSTVYLSGYSGGGGNVMSALTKFPDYFRAASAFFGMSDYGYDAATGWYNNGAEAGHKGIMNGDIGNPNTGGAAVLDRYMARASYLASRNNPYTEIHLFVNSNEVTVPKVNMEKYRDTAVAAASSPGEFDNINVHLGSAGVYQDFNGNHVNDANEQQYWPHGVSSANQQAAAENWFIGRVLDGSIPEPVLNATDELFVAGYVKTKKFALWLGTGENAAGNLQYQLTDDAWQFDLSILTSNPAETGRLTVDLTPFDGQQMYVWKDGVVQDSFLAAGLYTYNGIGNGDEIIFNKIGTVPEPATFVLAGLGLAAVAWTGCRRARS